MTDNKITFHVHERKIFGKAAKKLKQAGLIPANIYGLNQESVSISLDKKMVEKQLKVSETGLVYLELDDQKKPIPVLLDLVERHVLTTDLQHITFKRVSLTEKVVTDIELVLEGENSVPNATVLQVLDTLEVESLPTEIPESIKIDISELTEVGQVITIKNLIDRTKLAIICEEDQLEDPVVLLQEVKEEVEEESVEPQETIITGKGKADEEKDDESQGGAESGEASTDAN